MGEDAKGLKRQLDFGDVHATWCDDFIQGLDLSRGLRGMANQFMIVPSAQYLSDREALIENPRVLKELARLEALLSREGTKSCKEIHRVGDDWTIYLGEGRRVLVKPDGPHIHLLRLGEHDDVYRTHERASNKVLTSEPPPVTECPASGVTEPRRRRLFDALSDDFLRRLGVTPAQLKGVRECAHEGDLWGLAETLGDNLTQRLLECTESAPEDVLAEYENRGRDDEAQEILEDAERHRLQEEDARRAAEAKAAAAERDAESARSELQQAKAALGRAEEELASSAEASLDVERVRQLENQVARFTDKLAQLERQAKTLRLADPGDRGGLHQQEEYPGPSRATREHVASPIVRPGTRWTQPVGRERWRLSPPKTMARLSDNQSLPALVGADAAERIIADFLRVRPEGGRVWVDNQGNAVTLIAGQHVFLGQIVGGSSEDELPTDNTLRSAVVRALAAAPDSTAREIAFTLSRTGFTSVTRTEINSTLYRERSVFAKDESVVPRWRLTTAVLAPRTELEQPGPPRQDPVARRYRDAGRRSAYDDLLTGRPAKSEIVPVEERPTVPRRAPDQVLELMAWQQEAMERWYSNGCRGIVEAVTGTGKTHLGLEAAAHAAREGNKTTILVPSIDLQEQWTERFTTFAPWLEVARVGGKKSGDPARADVTIAVVHSALNHDLSSLGPETLVVADEVHRYGAEQFQYALRAKYERRLGLTATLERSGDDAVDDVLLPYFGGSILKVGFDRALRERVVAPFELVMAPIGLTEDEQAEYDTLSQRISNGLKVLRGSGALGSGNGSNLVRELGRLRGAGGRVGAAARAAESGMRQRRQLLANLTGKLDAIEELSELVESSQGTVIFTQSKDVAEEAAARLREWGVSASALHGEMPDRERKQSLDGLASGRLQALAAPKLLDEGIDVPTVDLGIVMTASRSRRQMVQRLGRVIRKKADGRPVRFVILYAGDTVEDPASGVHEGFFDLVGEVARNKVELTRNWTADDLLIRSTFAPNSIDPR